MKKKVSAVLAMVLACSSLPISIQANARNLYFPWYEPFHNQLGTNATFVVTGVSNDGIRNVYAVRGLKSAFDGDGDGGGVIYFKVYGYYGRDLEMQGKDTDELEVGDIFYAAEDRLYSIEYFSAPLYMLFRSNSNEEIELKYIANGIELWGDSFVEALRGELSWELSSSYDIGVLATEDNIIDDNKPELVLPPARPTGDEWQDYVNVSRIKNIVNKLEYYKNLEIVLDDDGYVMFDDDGYVICTDGKNLMTYSYWEKAFVYTDANGDNVFVDTLGYWKYIPEGEAIFYCVTDDSTPILNNEGEIDYYLNKRVLLEDEGNGVYSYPDVQGNTVYTRGNYIPGQYGFSELLTWKNTNILKGDATEDGEVNILDVIAVNKAILGQKIMSSSALKASDIDGDGIVSPNDSLAIMTYIVGLTDEL